MEKLNRIPKNHVGKINFEQYPDFYNSPYQDNHDYHKFYSIPLIKSKMRARVEIVLELNTDEDNKFLNGLKNNGLDYIANMGLDLDKFKEIINAGMKMLPIYLKHKDPEMAKMAWILSQYFAQRNDIITDKVIE